MDLVSPWHVEFSLSSFWTWYLLGWRDVFLVCLFYHPHGSSLDVFNWKWFLCFLILLIFLLFCEFRRNSYLLWSWRAVFIWECPCIACIILIFLVWQLFLVWMPATCFPQWSWLFFLWEWVWLMLWWQEPALDIEQGLLFALWLSQPYWGQDNYPQLFE